MDCSCQIDVDVDGYAEKLEDRIVVSRKNHICGECGYVIDKGVTYRYEKTVFEGKICVEKTCLDCNSIRAHMVCSFHWGNLLEEVREGIQEMYGEVPEECLSILTPKAREWVCEEIESCWDDDLEEI